MINDKPAFVVLVLLLVANAVLCQTFQYSHGWTNGKRSEPANSAEIFNPIPEDSFTGGELKRLRMLIHGNVDEQPFTIQCNTVGKLRRLVRANNFAPRLHENDDNY